MNEQSDTPRTDAWLAEEKRNPRLSGLGNWLDYCKQLERELIAARAEIEEYKTAFTEMNQALGVEVEEVEQLKLELTALTERRDKLDDQLDQILIRLGKTQEKMFDAEKQRDRLKEALKDVMKSGDSTIMYRTAEAALQSLTPKDHE